MIIKEKWVEGFLCPQKKPKAAPQSSSLPGSEAENRGLMAGDVIVAWGGTAIDRVMDLEGSVFAPETPGGSPAEAEEN